MERQQVDQRWVEDAFFLCTLHNTTWYPHFRLASLPHDVDMLNTLSKFTTLYHDAFMKYASTLKTWCGIMHMGHRITVVECIVLVRVLTRYM